MTESLLLIWRYEYALKSLNYTDEEIMNNNYKLPMYNMDTSSVVLYLLSCCWMRVQFRLVSLKWLSITKEHMGSVCQFYLRCVKSLNTTLLPRLPGAEINQRANVTNTIP